MYIISIAFLNINTIKLAVSYKSIHPRQTTHLCKSIAMIVQEEAPYSRIAILLAGINNFSIVSKGNFIVKSIIVQKSVRLRGRQTALIV